jgi:selenocysteine-specific translation elongation factor
MVDIVRFVVESAFELSGRGTVVVGRLEQGTVQAGGKLRLLS